MMRRHLKECRRHEVLYQLKGGTYCDLLLSSVNVLLHDGRHLEPFVEQSPGVVGTKILQGRTRWYI